MRRDEPRASIVVATYNVHGCLGIDGRFDTDRIGRVIEDLRADVVALQEVQWRDEPDEGPAQQLARALGMSLTTASCRRSGDMHFGNAILSRLPVHGSSCLDLSVSPFEPRSALRARIEAPGGRMLDVVATHLGLRTHERHLQWDRLEPTFRDPQAPLVVMGDLNAWVPGRDIARRVARCFGPRPTCPSFPTRWPILSLDRVLVAGPLRCHDVRAHRTVLSRVASDHFPVRATISLIPPAR